MAENSSGGRRGPFVELEALHKLLDRLKPDDSECTNSWYSSSEPCCREIVLRFKNLLNQWASDEKRLQDCLANDDSLTKCEHCGVIRCVEENINEKKRSNKTTNVTDEQSLKLNKPASKPLPKYTRKQEIMRNSHPVPRPYKSDMRNPSDKPTLGTNRRSLVSKEPLIDVFKARNDETIKRVDETSSIGIAATIVDRNSTQEYRKLSSRVEKCDPLMEAIKQLARENFSSTEDKSTPTKQSDLRKTKKVGKHSFALHGSRDADLHDNTGFLVPDRLRLDDTKKLQNPACGLPEEAAKLDTSTMCESVVTFSKPNKDSINATLYGSDTSAFSSSSAENMIRQWIKPGWNIRPINLENDKSPQIKNVPSDVRSNRVTKNVQTIETRRNRNGVYNQFHVDNNENFSHLKPDSDDKSVNVSDDHELLGISRAMTTTMWDEPKVEESSESPGLVSKKISENSISTVTPLSETSECFQREIAYDEISSKDAICDSANAMAASKVLLFYRKILESNEEMDWESFEHLVTALHPSQRDLWCDICKAVSNEAKRVAEETGATTEVCIEINPHCSRDKKRNFRYRPEEISFELDMTMKDIHVILEKNYSTISQELTETSTPHQEK